MGFRLNLRTGTLLGLVLVGLALPLVLYGVMIGRVPGVSPAQALRLMEEDKALLVRVDEGPGAEGWSDVAGGVSVRELPRWPLAEILRVHRPTDVPAEWRGRKVLMICSGGVRSALAARHLRAVGVGDVFSVRGGWQEWVSTAPGCPAGAMFRGSPEIDARIPAFRMSPAYEQWAVVAAFFGIKLVYSVVAAVIVGVLWRRREADLVALRWAMICFFVGEAFCFINVMVFFEDSAILEHLHSAGMVLSLGLAAGALLEGLDGRLIHFSGAGRCAAAGLCRGCIKHAPVPCGLRRLFLVVIPTTALLAALPLCSGFRTEAYNTRIFGALHSYRHPVIHQLYELRFLPLAAIVLLTAGFFVLLVWERRQMTLSKVLFAAALGALGFSLLRLGLVASFSDRQVWFAFWEEATELMYVGVIGGVLAIFARGLLTAPAAADEVAA